MMVPWQFSISGWREFPWEKMLSQAKRGITRQARSPLGLRVMLGVGAIGMLLWNGRLLVATGAGIGVTVLVYHLHNGQPKFSLSKVRNILRELNHPGLIAISAGAIAALTLYWMASVWADVESPWVASGMILQGMATMLIGLLLITRKLTRQERKLHRPYAQLVMDLAHADPLRRLIAVRQLTDAVSVLEDDLGDRPAGEDKKPARHDIADYFHLMLEQDDHPIVRDALYAGLQTLDIVYQLKQATTPLIQLESRPQSLAAQWVTQPIKPIKQIQFEP